jgi:phosphoribosylaminoimidazole-succinocarboxamide synthase
MVTSSRRKQLYEGKAKILFEGPDPTTIIQHFKDDASAFNNQKKGTIIGKGVLNNRISEYLMLKLESIGISTHFIKSLNMREQLIKKVDIIPLEVIIRNVAAGGLASRFGLEEGIVLPKTIIEFCLKSDILNNPLVNEDHINAFGWADQYELDEIKATSLRINDFLSGLFLGCGIRLIDFRLEFGRYFVHQDIEQVVLADEISPDTCRLWDIKTNEKMDKDRFRKDLGGAEEAYREVAKRLGIWSDKENIEEFE